jgi:glycine/D-amino acid oxidase-like deaminating enzyme
MKVAVIGGGFTCCKAALQRARDGHAVTLLESSEFQAFESLTTEMLQQGVVPGGWQHYARKEKIKKILSTSGKVFRFRFESSYA